MNNLHSYNTFKGRNLRRDDFECYFTISCKIR